MLAPLSSYFWRGQQMQRLALSQSFLPWWQWSVCMSLWIPYYIFREQGARLPFKRSRRHTGPSWSWTGQYGLSYSTSTWTMFLSRYSASFKVQACFCMDGLDLWQSVGDCLRDIQFCLAAQNRGELFSKAIKKCWTHVLLTAKIECLQKVSN